MRYTEESAENALKGLRRSNRSKIPVRSYSCNFCGGWHLTSRAIDYKLISYNIKNDAFKKYMADDESAE